MRGLLITIAGLAALGGAFLLGQQVRREAAPATPQPAQIAAPAAAPGPPPAPPPQPIPPGPPVVAVAPPPVLLAPAPSAAPPDLPRTPVARPAPAAPSFDHVRISAHGEMVLAGRADPGAEVTILFGADTLGVVRADLRGEWVFVPIRRIAARTGELSLRARSQDGLVTEGAAPVLVLVPDAPPPSTPTQPASTPAQVAALPAAPQAIAPVPLPPTVVELSRTPGGAPRVLQEALPEAPPPRALATGATTPVPAPGPAATPQRGPVSLQTVDYDERGEVRFAGTAAAGAPVRVYVDNTPVGQAHAGPDGRWTLTPSSPVAPGVHQLRVDQLGASGQVAARIEAPFQRVELPPEMLRDGQVVVQPGQNLWRIARGAYGRGVRYTVIYQANREQIRDPRLIYPGQVFSLPAAAN